MAAGNVATSVASGSPDDREEAFARARRDVFDRYRVGDYAGALATAREAAARFPDRDATTTYWTACLAAQAGQHDFAVRTLREALDRGLWWAGQLLLRGERDLAPLRERADFQTLAAEHERRRLRAHAVAAPDVVTIPPAASGPFHAREVPLLVALHMRNTSARDSAPHWAAVAESGAALGLAQSSQPFSATGFCWDDDVRSCQDVAWAAAEVRRRHPVDAGRLIVAGASQGGKLAVSLALAGTPVSWRGFIAVVPSIAESGDLLPLLDGASERRVRGWLMTGEHDRNRAGVEELHRHMAAHGVTCGLEVVPGLGHDFPRDFAPRLTAALAHVLA